MAVWNRSRRDDGKAKEKESEFVSLTDDDHAWWASREELERPWTPKQRDEEHEPDPLGGYRNSDFHKQFSAESLFDWADGTDTFVEGEATPPPGGVLSPDDPFQVLGISPSSSWEDVVAAHRQLAKLHHPDRLQDADPEQRAASEQLMRRVNAAYQQLQIRFRPA